MKLKVLFFALGLLFVSSSMMGQNHWVFDAGLQNHFQFNKGAIKNIEPAGIDGNMPRINFSATEGAAMQLGVSRFSDSSNMTWGIHLQNIWGTLVTNGAEIGNTKRQTELVQSNQLNLKLAIGYANKGKFKYSFQLGPVIPIAEVSRSSMYYLDDNNEYTAFYENSFYKTIGFWLAGQYNFRLNDRVNCNFGGGLQLLNKNIKSRQLSSFESQKGTQTLESYAPNTYNREYDFLRETKTGLNDATINPTGTDFNQPREVLTQNYSFSSLYIQFGINYRL